MVMNPGVAHPVPTQQGRSRWRRFTEIAGRVLDVPVVCVSLVDANHRLVTSSYGLSAPIALLLAWPFMTQVIASRHPVLITDGRTDNRVAMEPAMRDRAVSAYMGMRLVASDGCVVGALSVFDTRPRLWSGSQLEFLHGLSARIVREMELRTSGDVREDPPEH